MRYLLNNKSKNTLIYLSDDNSNFGTCDRAPLNIDYNWIIEEDGVLEYADKKYDVKKGDVVILTYSTIDKTKDLLRNQQVREIIIIENDSTYGKYINKQHMKELEFRNKESEVGCANDAVCCETPSI